MPRGGALLAPTGSEQFDHEGELVVVGRGGTRIQDAEALAHVAGSTCANDGSVRDFQGHSVEAGQNFARLSGIGHWLATADEVGDPARLTPASRLNGAEVRRSGTAGCSSAITSLPPGDVIATWSPRGVGAQRQPARWPKPGDRVEVEIERGGPLSDRVAA